MCIIISIASCNFFRSNKRCNSFDARNPQFTSHKWDPVCFWTPQEVVAGYMCVSFVKVAIGSWKEPLDTFGSLDNQKPKQSNCCVLYVEFTNCMFPRSCRSLPLIVSIGSHRGQWQ